MHVIILTNFCMARWKILVIIIAITCVCHSMSTYLGTWYIFFKWSGSDSTDKEGGISTILKSVLCSFSLRLLLFAVFLFEGDLIFFPPLTISYSDSRRLTQRHKRNVLRGQDSMSYNDTHQ